MSSLPLLAHCFVVIVVIVVSRRVIITFLCVVVEEERKKMISLTQTSEYICKKMILRILSNIVSFFKLLVVHFSICKL